MKTTKGYGVLIRLSGRIGSILGSSGDWLTFHQSDSPEVDTDALAPPLPVEYRIAPHPWQEGRLIAKSVRPFARKTVRGVVAMTEPTFGFVKLEDGSTAYFNSKIVADGPMKRGERVECIVVPGRDRRKFTLSMRRIAALAPSTSSAPSIGVASQKGSGTHKYINDDAFLVQEMAFGDTWLLAIADGVSSPPNGWWASDKCMELLWRSLPTYEAQFVQREYDERELMHKWVNEIHSEFLGEQKRAPEEYQQATSTLTFAVVRKNKVHWAHCGDTRLYVLDPAKKILLGAFSEQIMTQRARTRDGLVGLANHIGANVRHWEGLAGTQHIPAGGVVVLCSDGMVSRDLDRRKYDRIYKGLASITDIQAQVSDVVSQIAALGETDDLTLIALKPER